MASVRKIVFWLHLTTGLAAGLVILTMCVTGVLLAYEQQVLRWAEREYRSAAPGEKRLPLAALAESAARQSKGSPTTVLVRRDPAAPVEVAGGAQGGLLFVDAYTGEVRGKGATGLRSFFRTTTDIHRRLAATGPYRDAGRAVTGASNLMFLGLVLSGVVLWAPRVWSWRNVRRVTWFRRDLSGKARDFNWHNTIGFWCALPLTLIVLGALVISYPWATNLVYTMTGTPPPPPARGGGAGPGSGNGGGGAGAGVASAALAVDRIEAAFAGVQARTPEWKAISFRVPRTETEPLAFTVDLVSERGRPDQRHVFTVNPVSGEIKEGESFADYNSGRKVRTLLRWIHTGELGGLPGQTVAAVASAGGAVLVWTGIALALKRFKAWKSRRGARSEAAVVEAVETAR